MTARGTDFAPGVYGTAAEGRALLIHAYQGGPYRLADINRLWLLGRVEGGLAAGESVLWLDRAEIRKLKTLADAFSFDFEQGFIEMCHAMAAYAADRGDEEIFRFVANF